MSFYNEQGSKTGILEVHGMADVEPDKYSNASVKKEGIAPEQTVKLEDPWNTLGGRVSSSWRTSGRGNSVSPGTKELMGAIFHQNPSV